MKAYLLILISIIFVNICSAQKVIYWHEIVHDLLKYEDSTGFGSKIEGFEIKRIGGFNYDSLLNSLEQDGINVKRDTNGIIYTNNTLNINNCTSGYLYIGSLQLKNLFIVNSDFKGLRLNNLIIDNNVWINNSDFIDPNKEISGASRLSIENCVFGGNNQQMGITIDENIISHFLFMGNTIITQNLYDENFYDLLKQDLEYTVFGFYPFERYSEDDFYSLFSFENVEFSILSKLNSGVELNPQVDIHDNKFTSINQNGALNISGESISYLLIENNTFENFDVILGGRHSFGGGYLQKEMKIESKIVFSDNLLNGKIAINQLTLPEQSNQNVIHWNQIEGDKLVLADHANAYDIPIGVGMNLYYTTANISDFKYWQAYEELISNYKLLNDIYRDRGNLSAANGIYYETKKIEGKKLEYEYNESGSLKNWFQ